MVMWVEWLKVKPVASCEAVWDSRGPTDNRWWEKEGECGCKRRHGCVNE